MATEKDIIKDAKDAFSEFSDQESEQRERMLQDYEFRALKQWPEALKSRRESDPNGARPCLVLDRTNQHVRQVVNDARIQRPGMRVRPRDSDADPKTAEMLNGLIRHIETKPTSRSDIAYDWALECAATAGLGWFRIGTEIVDDDGNQEPRIIRVANPMSVYVGTGWTEPDGCDIMSAIVTVDMGRKEYERKYINGKSRSDKADPCSFEGATGDELEWIRKDTVRIAEFMTVEEAPNDAKYKRIVRWYKVTAREVLEQTLFPSSYTGLVPVIGTEIWEGNKRILMGMVRPAMDPQRMYNLARSNYAEHVSMAPRAKWVAAEGQLEGYESDWRQSNTSSNPVLTYHSQIDGQPVPPPQRVFGPEVPQGIAQDMALSERDLQSAMGQYGASLGAPSQERSGIAIKEKKSEGDRGNFHYIDNLSRSVRHGTTIVVEMIPRLYDTKRITRILGQDGKDSMAEIDPDQSESYARYRQADGTNRTVFNPGVGSYDVVPANGPSYATQREESSEAMLAIVQANPDIMATHGDLIFKAQDWPDADAFAKRFKMLLPPQIKAMEEAEEHGEPMDPQAMAAIAQREQQIQQMGMQMQAMQKALMEMQQKASSTAANEVKAQTDQMRVQIDQQSQQIEAFRAQTERMKAEAEIQAKQIEMMTVETEQRARDVEVREREETLEGREMERDQVFSALQSLALQLQTVMGSVSAIQQQVASVKTVNVEPIKDEMGNVIGGRLQRADGSVDTIMVQ